MRNFILTGLLLVVFSAPVYAAYTDQVEMSADEFWNASLQVLQKYGIRKQNEKKRIIETKWTEDRVRRSQGLTKDILVQAYQRRYKVKLTIREDNGFCEATIRGVFQIRSDAGPMIPWKKIKPKGSERQIEREIFFEILSLAALNRAHKNALTPPAN